MLQTNAIKLQEFENSYTNTQEQRLLKNIYQSPQISESLNKVLQVKSQTQKQKLKLSPIQILKKNEKFQTFISKDIIKTRENSIEEKNITLEMKLKRMIEQKRQTQYIQHVNPDQNTSIQQASNKKFLKKQKGIKKDDLLITEENLLLLNNQIYPEQTPSVLFNATYIQLIKPEEKSEFGKFNVLKKQQFKQTEQSRDNKVQSLIKQHAELSKSKIQSAVQSQELSTQAGSNHNSQSNKIMEKNQIIKSKLANSPQIIQFKCQDNLRSPKTQLIMNRSKSQQEQQEQVEKGEIQNPQNNQNKEGNVKSITSNQDDKRMSAMKKYSGPSKKASKKITFMSSVCSSDESFIPQENSIEDTNDGFGSQFR
eukprot:403363062